MKYNIGGVILSILLCVSCADNEKKQIVCWGDSLTAPHVGSNLKGKIKKLLIGDMAYPAVLEQELGGEYEIVNCGVGGENTLTIMARQGAFPMAFAHDVTVYADDEREFPQYIGNHDMPAFVSTYNGKKVSPLEQGGYDENAAAKVNLCIIDGRKYEIRANAKFWRQSDKFIFQTNYILEPESADTSYVIPAGTIVETKAMRELRDKYAYVFFIGQNGGFDSNADLIRQLRAMIDYSGSGRFVVISYHIPNIPNSTIALMRQMEDTLAIEFGSHYINLRDSLVTKGLQDAGLIATQIDKDSIAHGAVPPQLLSDGVHFTKTGYQLLGKLVARKFRELDY